MPYVAGFPYLAAPHSGWDRIHANFASLQNGRFTATVTWKRPDGGTGTATPVGVAGNTQSFWFFTPDNIDLTAKILDGRTTNGHFWVFYGSMTNVEFTLTVTDTQTRAQKVYTNPQGQNSSVADTSAF